MDGSLPFNASLEALRREARKLLRALRGNDITTTTRYHPEDLLERASHAGLADAQYIIARRYGFKSWANLEACLTTGRTK